MIFTRLYLDNFVQVIKVSLVYFSQKIGSPHRDSPVPALLSAAASSAVVTATAVTAAIVVTAAAAARE